MKKNGFEKLQDITFMSSLTLQSTQLLSRPRTPANIAGTTQGLVGITIAGVAAKAGSELIKNSFRQKKKKTKRR